MEPPQAGGKGHCGGKDVVGSAWIDLLLPYCADPRHAPDTKFFIIEQDWRLYPEDLEVNFESPDDTGEYGSSNASTDVAPSSMPRPVRYQAARIHWTPLPSCETCWPWQQRRASGRPPNALGATGNLFGAVGSRGFAAASITSGRSNRTSAVPTLVWGTMCGWSLPLARGRSLSKLLGL